MDDLDIFREFVLAIESVPYHKKWRSANKNSDTPLWDTYKDLVLAGESPAEPVMATRYGRALIDAGEMVVNNDVTSPPAPPAPEIPEVLRDHSVVVSISGELEAVPGGFYTRGAHIQSKSV